jgi:Putative beta-barrel porin-2, OmpL-like. bbp2
MVDIAYGLNFNFPENHQWRSKETTPRTNELAPNMVLGYFRKDALKQSRWGLELAVQGGYDTDALVPEPEPGRDQPIDGADVLRHVARANLSYLTAIGNGLKITAGLMEGYINYESFYSVNNYNYTRAYLTDYNPNFMLGLSARYPFTGNFDVGVHVMNGFNYLSHPNDVPSLGADMDWRITKRLTFAQNLYYGPDQESTSLRFWRLFSDTQLEWRDENLTLAAIYDMGTEQAADQAGSPRQFWTSGALATRYTFTGPWSVAVRPEVFWDRHGLMTKAEQLIWAVTSTLEYRRHFRQHLAVIRLEHRYDRSTGQGGGFFGRDQTAPDASLSPDQHLLFLSLIWAYDS